MRPTTSSVASALATSARAIGGHHSLDETLDAITRAARASIPGFDHAGISLVHRDGSIETKAATGSLVWELDALQYETEEGPCVAAMRGPDAVVSAAELQHDQRWPRYVAGAVRAGVRSQMGIRLDTDRELLGGLNLYSTVSSEIDPRALETAEPFAAQAALALSHVRETVSLADAVSTRQIIGTAVGLTMGRYRIDRERAFQFLVRASSTSSIKVRVIAQEVVDAAEESYRSS